MRLTLEDDEEEYNRGQTERNKVDRKVKDFHELLFDIHLRCDGASGIRAARRADRRCHRSHTRHGSQTRRRECVRGARAQSEDGCHELHRIGTEPRVRAKWCPPGVSHKIPLTKSRNRQTFIRVRISSVLTINASNLHTCISAALLTCTPLLSRAIIELSIPLSRKVPRFQTPHAPAQPYYPRAHNLKKAQRNTISIVVPVNSPNHATCTECSQRMPSIVLPPARLASSRRR